MRAFAWRHPNVMVVLYAGLWVLSTYCFFLADQWWYHRTGGPPE